MITYINAKNAEDYQILFGKAAKVLKDAQPHAIGDSLAEQGLTWDDFAIGSLNEYFAYLQDIMAATKGDKQKFFVRLPLDEDVFAINADTRVITVPSNFSRYGVGVQGDEMAEVVYFTIDRFFDSMDLANDNIQIAIQWEAKDANKQSIIGISRNFGKDIESIPGKIIFGWPISHELTQTNGSIKFAVRFYTIDTVNNQFTYSFTTLPADVSVNASLDYDLINKSVREIDHGAVITGRIRNSGIYDPAAERPEEPTITTELYIMAPEGNEASKIVDLPTNGSGVSLAIAAKPTTSGVIVYDWKKYIYDTISGNYAATASALPVADAITVAHVEITEDIPANDNGRYYKLVGGAYELTTLTGFAAETDGSYRHYENGFRMEGSNSFVKLYKELSVATVHSVGKYAVDVSARVLANTAKKEMTAAEAITIPGPLKPVIEFEEGTVVSNNVAHIISNEEQSAVLKVNAIRGEYGKPAEEVGEDPQVTLAYVWKQKINGIDAPIEDVAEPGPIEFAPVPASNINWTGDYAVNNEKARANQNKATVVQDGNDIIVYINGELEEFASSNPGQGTGKWLALDIDTHEDSIIGLKWGPYPITEDDEVEAASIGLGAGHIVYWAKVTIGDTQTVTIGKVIPAEEDGEEDTIEETQLRITYSAMPENIEYGFNADKSEMTIVGLPTEMLDSTYFVEVTATRNGISTTGASGDYRITNNPEKPIIKVRKYNSRTNNFELVEKDYQSEDNIERITRRAGQVSTMSFSVEPPAQSDTLSYIWMRINADTDIASDWEGNAEKLQVDLDDAIEGLAAIVGNPAGSADFPVETAPIEAARKYFDGISAIGDIASEDFEDNGPKYELSAKDPAGYYYCVVINELNGHINANVSPFFQVS